MVCCPTSWTKPNSCQRPEGSAVPQALSPLAVVQMEGAPTHTHTIPWMLQGAGGEKGIPSMPVDPETHGLSSQTTAACCKKTKQVRIIASRHIFTGMETVSSEIALKYTGPFCSFPGGWRLFGWRRAEWEEPRGRQISEMLTQMRSPLLCALLSSSTTFVLYRKCFYVLWKETGVKRVCFY